MNARMASFAVILLTVGPATLGLQALNPQALGGSAFARQASAAKPASAKPAHRAAARKAPSSKNAHAAVPDALAAIPEAERLAIQGDLVWLGNFTGMSAEEFGGRTVEAIKAFQKRNNGKETGVLNPQERALLAEAAKAPQARVGWRLIDDSASGARVGVPEKLAPRAGAGRTGSRWTSALGQIQIETFRLHEASLPALFEQEKKSSQRQIGFSALNPDSFVIVGEQHLKKFVMRAQSNGSEVRGVTVLYDQATEGTMAPVAVAIADTFAGFPDPNAGSTAGHKRGVEYGSAVVVSDRGDVLTALDVTDECQSITVPGFAHADRVAEDRTNGLALLRLYGARNLVPAAIAGDGVTSSNLTLFGIADPLAQAGDGAVNSSTAVLTAQDIVPAPKPGFSGAAALDGQGQYAGIVTLKSAVVAGPGPVIRQAALVPAAAVRAFLNAQGIALAAGNTAIDQSVVRLICVRK
jgi:hypothetical protein